MKTPQSPESPWVTKQLAAKHFGVCLRTITNWLKRKVLIVLKLGHVVRIHIKESEAQLRRFGMIQ